MLASWLDALDETGRWALLKLITGGLRIGVSARLAKTALAALGNRDPNEVEEVWHGVSPPYLELFAWIEGKSRAPESRDPAPFRPPMLAHPLEEGDVSLVDPLEFIAEWKWDGIRVQAAAGRDRDGRTVARIYSRTGEDISGAFPDLRRRLDFDAAIDGELLVSRDGRVQSFNELQQRLNRKAITPKLMATTRPISAPMTFWSRARRICAPCPSSSAARASPRCSTASAIRRSTCRPLSLSPASTNSPPPAPIRSPPAPATTRKRSRG